MGPRHSVASEDQRGQMGGVDAVVLRRAAPRCAALRRHLNLRLACTPWKLALPMRWMQGIRCPSSSQRETSVSMSFAVQSRSCEMLRRIRAPPSLMHDVDESNARLLSATAMMVFRALQARPGEQGLWLLTLRRDCDFLPVQRLLVAKFCQGSKTRPADATHDQERRLGFGNRLGKHCG